MEAKKRRGINIPHDIVVEILVKVPVESLVRFKGVTEEWRRTIESKWFIEKHTRYEKSLGGRQARILRVVQYCGRRKKHRSLTVENILFMPSPTGRVDSSSYRLIIRPLRLPHYFRISQPCDGLFCFYARDHGYHLVNPATKSHRILPDPAEADWDTTGYSLLGIGRENSVSPRYKLVWLFSAHDKVVNKLSTRCKVFALDSNTWRYVDPPNCQVDYGQPIIHLDGMLYCVASGKSKLLAFDLHTETFHSFLVTPGSTFFGRLLPMCVLNHRLCIFKPFIGDQDLFFKIWALDINKTSWEIMYSVDLSRLPPIFDHNNIIFPVATIDDNVVISNSTRSMWVLYDGSKTHILHRTPTSTINFFPFIETLVSIYQ